MPYSKQLWNQYDKNKTIEDNIQNDAVITPAKMNHIEDGFSIVEQETKALVDALETVVDSNLTATDEHIVQAAKDVDKSIQDFKQEVNEDFLASNQSLVQLETETDKKFVASDNRITDIEEDVVVEATNEFYNSDFSKGLEGWSGYTSAKINEESVAFDFRIFRTTNLPPNHKAYMRAEVKKNEGLGNIILIRAPKTFATLVNPIIGQWYKLSGVTEEGTANTVFQVSAAQGTIMEVKKNLIVIDLTKTFGAGNEPTATQMDRLLEQFPNSWFDGTQNIFLASWALNELRRLDDEKANRKQEEWITPTLLNGYESVPSFPIMYRKDEIGVVRFRGRIQKGNVTGSAYPFLILPNGYKPTNNYILYPCSHATKTSVATIGVYNGLYLDSPYSSYVCLDNISFFGEV